MTAIQNTDSLSKVLGESSTSGKENHAMTPYLFSQSKITQIFTRTFLDSTQTEYYALKALAFERAMKRAQGLHKEYYLFTHGQDLHIGLTREIITCLENNSAFVPGEERPAYRFTLPIDDRRQEILEERMKGNGLSDGCVDEVISVDGDLTNEDFYESAISFFKEASNQGSSTIEFANKIDERILKHYFPSNEALQKELLDKISATRKQIAEFNWNAKQISLIAIPKEVLATRDQIVVYRAHSISGYKCSCYPTVPDTEILDALQQGKGARYINKDDSRHQYRIYTPALVKNDVRERVKVFVYSSLNSAQQEQYNKLMEGLLSNLRARLLR